MSQKLQFVEVTYWTFKWDTKLAILCNETEIKIRSTKEGSEKIGPVLRDSNIDQFNLILPLNLSRSSVCIQGYITDVCVPISKLPEVLVETQDDLKASPFKDGGKGRKDKTGANRLSSKIFRSCLYSKGVARTTVAKFTGTSPAVLSLLLSAGTAGFSATVTH